MKKLLLSIIATACSLLATAQSTTHPAFPQQQLNAALQKALHTAPSGATNTTIVKSDGRANGNEILHKMDEVKKMNWAGYKHPGASRSADTVYVGVVPHDTMVITGPYTHNGPILVFNDGVLIFYNATSVNYGDIFVFEHGRVLGLNSSLTFPQDYFYQRSLLVVQHGIAYFNNCSFNYSGMQHNLVVGDSGAVGMETVHQADWTTAGLYGDATIQVHGLNLGGEYILADSSHAAFSNVDTLLLWHKIPQTATINYSFPLGDTVNNYMFDNTVSGVSGIGYHVYADSCHTVWWALMPVNGSSVTVSNSNLRVIGNWFQHSDTATVNGIYNGTFYANNIIPLSDRMMHLTNTYVQTWNMYAFDTSQVSILNSTLGEVGTEQHAAIFSQQFLLDGSGGYFWATDTSVVFASDVTVYSTARSERNGIFVLSYSTMPFTVPTSIGSSLMISVQNTLPADPVPYDGSVMWMEKIDLPGATVHADSLIPVTGSEWIDQGPMGSWMDYGSYSLYYRLLSDTAWTPIVSDSAQEIRHNTLGVWNTTGLAPGNYYLRLLVHNDQTDSVEDLKPVTILPAIATGLPDAAILNAAIYPNPATDHLVLYLPEGATIAEVHIYNLLGEVKLTTTTKDRQNKIDTESLSAGVYTIEVRSGNKVSRKKFVKE